jgi:hypothetical protein
VELADYRVRQVGQPLATRVLQFAAAFALAWSIFRAGYQSITLDEADTYFWFVAPGPKYIWFPFPNNHILNTLLIWVSTHLFGLSVFTVRIPALLGACLYTAVAYFLCRALTKSFALQFATFICLVYNPLILDFFAAARGYSLATAFLLAALAIPVWHQQAGRKSVRSSAALASAAIGLSFAANFSFAYVDAFALLAISVWAVRRRRTASLASILVSCIAPAALVTLALCGYPLLHYPRKELWFGATSLRQMTASLVEGTFYRVHGPLADSRVVQVVDLYLLPALLGMCLCKLVVGWREKDFRQDVRVALTAAVAAIFVATLAAHYGAFRLGRLPLPLSRTGIFFVPLATLMVGLVAALPTPTRALRLISHGITGLFLLLALHCVLCLRYSYFKEYEWNADTKDVYKVIDQLNRRYGVREFASAGSYLSPLNF